MRSRFAVTIAVLTLSLAAVAPAVAAPSSSYIVTFRDGVAIDATVAAHGRAYGLAIDHVYRYALHGYAAHMSPAAAQALAADSRVASVVADRAVSIDAQTLPTGINRIDGEASSTQSGNGSGSVDVDVAVIDTGISTHPDLNIAGGTNCSSGRKTNFNDGNGHGTHVAGTIAAKDDENGVVGVAPGARLWAVRVLNNAGSGTWASVICGIDWVTGRAGTIEVANMSLGGSGSDPANGQVGNCSTGDALHDAICKSVKQGVTYAVAAGNSASNASGFVPAAYDDVITVSALADFDGVSGGLASPTCRSDEDDTFANFSNFGADVDLIAPGVCIYSTWKGGGYNTISGTSMASPHVAGAAALYKSTHPTATPSDVKAALIGAGTTNDWSGDPDANKEPLLKVASF
jgi:subtilisin family serine protease